MSTFNPSQVSLVDVYTDAAGQSKSATVYPNGNMQISLFIAIVYYGSTNGILDDINTYVQDNAEIFMLPSDSCIMIPVQWQRSVTDNGFPHTITTTSGNSDAKTMSNIMVPLYIIPPLGVEGITQHWIIKLGQEQTMTASSVTINTVRLVVDASNFEIVDIATSGAAKLRALRYKPGVYPVSYQLVKPLKLYEKGIRFTHNGGNTWLVRLNQPTRTAGLILEYPETNVHTLVEGYSYTCSGIYFLCQYTSFETYLLTSRPYRGEGAGWTDANNLVPNWTQGVMMIYHEDGVLYRGSATTSFTVNEPFFFQDSFGSAVKIRFNWAVGDDSTAMWMVTSAVTYYM